jgi:ERCC4-type nuclease
MRICIDEREHHLYHELMNLCSVLQGSHAHIVQITKKVLTLGDMLIEYDDGTVALLIERKTLLDMLASIRDSRYEEQSYRLIHSSGVPRHNIVYLIEGIMNQLSQQKDRDLIYSAATSLNHYKGFSVYRTVNALETAQWLWAVTLKLHRNHTQKKSAYFSSFASTSVVVNQDQDQEIKVSEPDNTIDQEQAQGHVVVEPYCSVVKKVKKDNITPDNLGEIVLCQIPSISSVSAVAIMKKFGTLAQLIAALQTDSACLDGITTTSPQGTRKLSSAVAANLRRFLIPPPPPPPPTLPEQPHDIL